MKNLLVLFFITSIFVSCTDKKKDKKVCDVCKKQMTEEVVTDSNSVKLEGLINADTTELETPTPEVVEKVIEQ